MILAVLVLVVTRYRDVFGLELANDDWLVLDKLLHSGLASIWAPRELLSGYWRPWSRECHYLVVSHVSGTRPWAYHAFNLAAFVAALALYAGLVARLLGRRAAGIAVCLVASLAAWGTLLVWAAGAQDLWAIVAGLGFLLAFARGANVLAFVALVVAVLSKETAAILPVLATTYALCVDREPFVRALRRTAVLYLPIVAFALVHPPLGGGAWMPPLVTARAIARTALNLDVAPRPEHGASWALLTALPFAVVAAAAAAVCARAPKPAPAATSQRGVLLWLGTWTLLGGGPLLAPGLHYHAYYGLWSCLGAFAVLASWLQASPVAASGVVLGIALLRVARTDTPQVGLGSEWYHRRAAALTRVLHADLVAARPSLPHHSRLYFAMLPSGVGMVSSPGYSAPVHVWYADTTLRGYLVSQYARRAPADTAGGDYFFESDDTDTGHLHEIVAGAEDLRAARGDPDWRRRHGELGVLFASAGDFAAAAVEFKKLVLVDPGDAEAMERVAACLERLGRPAAAAEWTARAAAVRAASPGARP